MGVIAKSVVFDIADNHGDGLYVGARSVEFFLNGTLYSLSASDITATATQVADATYYKPEFVFNTSLSKTGSHLNNGWLASYDEMGGGVAGVRLICVLNTAIEIDQIVVNNMHHNGSSTDAGANNTTITISSETITDTTFEAIIANATVIYSGPIREHSAEDSADDEVLLLSLSAPESEEVVYPDPEITQAGQYTLTITGSPPELIPCANFLARMRSGRRSYLQATIPYTQAMADLISTRPTEDLELRFYDSAGDPHVILTVALDGIQITKGVQSSSIVLTGWRQSTNSTPATHSDIQAMTVSSGTNSSTIVMPGYRPEIKPADTVEAEGVSFAAGLVTVQGAARRNDIDVRTTMAEEATV